MKGKEIIDEKREQITEAFPEATDTGEHGVKGREVICEEREQITEAVPEAANTGELRREGRGGHWRVGVHGELVTEAVPGPTNTGDLCVMTSKGTIGEKHVHLRVAESVL